MRRKQTHSRSWLIVGLTAIIVVLVAVLAFVLGQKSNQTTTKQAGDSADKSAKVATSASSRSTRKAPKTSQLTTTLRQLTQVAGEDTATRTNGGDITYSQFYQSKGTWYWNLTSSKRGQLEVGKIAGVTQKGSTQRLNVTSQIYHPGTAYVLDFSWLDQSAGRYHLNTSFESINGDYTLGQTETVDQTPNKDIAMLVTLGSGVGEESEETRTNGGDITYSSFVQDDNGTWYWYLESSKRGLIESGKVAHIATDGNGNPAKLTIEDELGNSGSYTLTIAYKSDDDGEGEYRLDTSHESIHGYYEIQDYDSDDD